MLVAFYFSFLLLFLSNDSFDLNVPGVENDDAAANSKLLLPLDFHARIFLLLMIFILWDRLPPYFLQDVQ